MSRKRGREALAPLPPPVNEPSTPSVSTRSALAKQAAEQAAVSSPRATRSSSHGRKSTEKKIEKTTSRESLNQNLTNPVTPTASSNKTPKNNHIAEQPANESKTLKDELIATPSIDEHPFTVGHCLTVRYRDGAERLAKIIERNFQVDNQWTYYVHYFDFNRRNDEWIDISRIVCPPSVANQLEEKYQQLHTKHSQQLPEKNAAPSSSSSRGKESHSTHELRYTTVADLDHDEHEGFDEESLLEHERVTKVKNIQYVQLGRHIMECWYFSPFPKEYYPNGYADCLYFCEFSLRFFRTKEELVRFQQKSQTALPRHPPGHEIYRDDNLSMFEIDGAVEKIYSQNLCYLAKLFLDHKTLYWDVDPFLFYVLCTRDSRGFHPVGYFSKEKYSEAGYNLACILSFPSVQRKGYGRFLIEFSYELSKKEEKVGSPEKPLSDLGALGYRSYWASTIVRFLRQCGQTTVSIMDITCATSILPDDVISTLELLGLLRDPATAGGQEPAIYAPTDLLEELMRKYPEARMKVDADKLHWTPFYTVDPKKDKWSIVSMKSATGPSAPSAATAPATAAAQPMEM